MRDGEMLLERAWGVADIEKNVSASKSTTYPVGSVTKQFTAALVLKQVDRGRLTLTDPIGKHHAGLTAEVSCPFTGHDRKDIRGCVQLGRQCSPNATTCCYGTCQLYKPYPNWPRAWDCDVAAGGGE